MFKKSLIFFLLAVSIGCETAEQEPAGESSSVSKYSYKSLNMVVDSLQYNQPLELDLNGDNQIDFLFTSLLLEENDKPYLYLIVNRKSPYLNKMIVRIAEPFAANGLWAVPLEKNTRIEEAVATGTEWIRDLGIGYLLNVSDNGTTREWGGEWLGKGDKYLGLKFKINGVYHFGWLRISHKVGEAKLAILDYAYNKEAGKAILAGQK